MSRPRLQFSPTPDMVDETTTGFPGDHPAHWEATRDGAVVGRYSFLLNDWEVYIPGRAPHRCRTETAARLWLIRHAPDVPVVEANVPAAQDHIEADLNMVPNGAAARWADTSTTEDTNTVPFAQVRALLDAVEAVLDMPKHGAPDAVIYGQAYASGALSTVENVRGIAHAAEILRRGADSAQGVEGGDL